MVEEIRTILIVIGRRKVRDLINRHLRSIQWPTKTATTAKTAVRLITSALPTLMILDYELFDCEPLNCQQLEQIADASKIPIFYLTKANNQNNHAPASKTDYVTSYMSWPAKPTQIITAIQALLGIQQTINQSKWLKQQWQAVFELINDGIILIDLTGKILQVNRALASQLNIWVGTAITGSLLQFLSLEQQMAMLRQLSQGKNYQLSDIAIEQQWFELHARVIRAEDGNPVGGILVLSKHSRCAELSLQERVTLAAIEAADQSTLNEVRNQKQQESEKLFRQLAENIRDVLWVSGPLGARITYVSPAFEEIWGYSCQSLYEQSQTFLNLIDKKDRAKVREAFRRLLYDNVTYDEEYRITRPDGSQRWIHDRAFPIRNEQAEVYRIVGIAEDITERKQAEARLLATQEHLRALSTRVQMLQEEERTRIAQVIHDEFGQALTALKIDLIWLKQRHSTEQAVLVNKIVTMIQLVDTTITTVRRISTDLRPRVLDDLGLAAATEWAIKEFQARTEIACQLTIKPEDLSLPPNCATAIFRILQEALTNIARHAEATNVAIRLIKNVSMLLLEVEDNGKGICEEEINKNTSLGLIGIKERAFLWAGKVEITGRIRQGTLLRVTIPLPLRNEK